MALLGLSALFQQEINKIGIEVILVISAIILVAGLTYLIIITITEFENSIKEIEQKFIREKELNKIRKDVEALKLIIRKNE